MFSDHAMTRMAQRHLSATEVEYVVLYGRRLHTGGAIHCFLRWKDIPQDDRGNANIARLEGTTVLLSADTTDTVITVFRNRSALKDITRKVKYLIQRRRLE